MPKEYPGFIIDRSRRSEQSKHSDDYIVCTDDQVGFVGRVYKLNRTQFGAHNAMVDTLPPDDADCRFAAKNYGEVAIVLEVVKLLHPPLVDRPRIKSLLKKALKAYLNGEVGAVKGDGSNIDKQIAVVAEMERLTQAQFESLKLNNGTVAANEIVTQLHAAGKSLHLFKLMLKQPGSHGQEN